MRIMPHRSEYDWHYLSGRHSKLAFRLVSELFLALAAEGFLRLSHRLLGHIDPWNLAFRVRLLKHARMRKVCLRLIL